MPSLSSLISKKAIRALGIAESFRLSGRRSVLAGVVCRSDGIIDGVCVDLATVGGLDATESVIRIYGRLDRRDVHVIMLDGCIISWYNIVDLEEVHRRTGVPVISITFERAEGDVERAIRTIFCEDSERRASIFRRLPRPQTVILRSGEEVYVRCVGIDVRHAEIVLNKFTREGKRPEPIRIAKLIANAVLNSDLYGP